MARKFLTNLTAEELREQLTYDSETGTFLRRSDGGAIGSMGNGYWTITINRQKFLAHRLAWLYVYGAWPEKIIDHTDGDRLNNAIRNLRECSDIENHQNTLCRGFRLKGRKYQARITFNKKQICLGHYDTPEAARAAYEAASLKFFGQFSAVTIRGMKA